MGLHSGLGLRRGSSAFLRTLLFAGPLLLSSWLGFGSGPIQNQRQVQSEPRGETTESRVRQPMTFVLNEGQWTHGAKFVARKGREAYYLSPHSITAQVVSSESRSSRVLNVALEFEGASKEVQLRGEGPHGVRHFFRGTDPKEWRRDVAAFDQVLYQDLYPGIDLRVRELEGHLEYDLLLSPEADLSDVIFHCKGGQGLSILKDGSLVVSTALGDMQQKKPRTWQVQENGRKLPIECNYVRLDANRYGFEVEGVKPGLPIVIDPGIEWSTYVGGTGDEHVYDVVVSASGTVTITGETSSSDFPLTPGVHDNMLGGSSDVFVTRLGVDASEVLFSTFLGGSLREAPKVLLLDNNEDLIIAGETNSPDFPLTAGAPDTSRDELEGFLVHLSGDGATLLYSTYFGGTNHDRIEAAVLSDTNEVTFTGETFSTDLPTTSGAYDESSNGGLDAFVGRIQMGGQGINDLVYSSYLGGAKFDFGRGLATDSSGRTLVVGRTFSPLFPTTAGAFDTTYGGKGDGFLARVSADGSTLEYATFIGSTGFDSAECVASSLLDEVVVGGDTWSSDFETTAGVVQSNLSGSSDSFLARFDLQGSGAADRVWSSLFGGERTESLFEICLDELGDINAVGFTRSRVYPTTPDASETEPVEVGSRNDGFFVRLKADGTETLHSTYVRGDGDVLASAIALEGLGSAVLVGETSTSVSFTTTTGVFQKNPAGGDYEVYVRRLTIPQDVESSMVPQSSTVVAGERISMDVTATNNTASGQILSGRMTLFHVDGTPSVDNPVVGPINRILPGSRTANKTFRYRIPEGTAPGFYILRLILARQGDVLSLSSFPFEVTP